MGLWQIIYQLHLQPVWFINVSMQIIKLIQHNRFLSSMFRHNNRCPEQVQSIHNALQILNPAPNVPHLHTKTPIIALDINVSTFIGNESPLVFKY